MRFIHTSDWHLGRILHGVHLTEDQSHILEQFVSLVKDTSLDAVLIAGDIYDRSVPPPDAVQLLDELLSRVVVDLNVPVLLIAGNHDSPERLAFGAKLLARQNMHTFGTLEPVCKPVVLHDKDGPVYFYSTPYAEPPLVRQQFQDETLKDHDLAMKRIVGDVLQSHPTGKRSVLMTHAFVAGGESCESERPLSVGGSGSVDASCFADFNYVALGHLHRPQKLGGGNVHYSGSLMKYSFSEATHQKSISIVEMDASGQCAVEKVSLSPKRDVRRIKGYLNDVIQSGAADENKNDFLDIELLDEGAIFDAIGQLRDVYPNVLHIERPFLSIDGSNTKLAQDHRKITDLQLFTSFFEQVTGETISDQLAESYATVIDDLRKREREGVV